MSYIGVLLEVVIYLLVNRVRIFEVRVSSIDDQIFASLCEAVLTCLK